MEKLYESASPSLSSQASTKSTSTASSKRSGGESRETSRIVSRGVSRVVSRGVGRGVSRGVSGGVSGGGTRGVSRKGSRSPELRKGRTDNIKSPDELMITKLSAPSTEYNISTEYETGIEMNEFELLNKIHHDLSECVDKLHFLRNSAVCTDVIKAVVKANFKKNLNVSLKSLDTSQLNMDYFRGLFSIVKPNDKKYTIATKRASVLSDYDALSDFFPLHKKTEMMKLLKLVTTPNFDVFLLDDLSSYRPLTTLAFHIFIELNIRSTFKIPNIVMITNLMKLENGYRGLPYHNNLHATDVLATTYQILSCPSLKNVFSEVQIFALLLACIVHDIDHAGFTNSYVVNTNSKLATLYSASVLEHHHANLAFRILLKESPNIFSNFKQPEMNDFRELVTNLVLATDAANHVQLYLEINAMVSMNKQPHELNHVDKLSLMKNIIHTADVSNPTKPLDQYKIWINRVMSEFFRQGEKERSKGLDISTLCDRSNADLPMSQVNFINYIVEPLWTYVGKFVGKGLEVYLKRMEENKEYFKKNTFQFNEFPTYFKSNEEDYDIDETLIQNNSLNIILES